MAGFNGSIASAVGFGGATRASSKKASSGFVSPRLMLVVAVAALVLIGIVMVYSASMVEAYANGDDLTSYVAKQVIFVVLGVVIAFALYRFLDYRILRSNVVFGVLWGITFLSLVAVWLLGTEIYGATRWIYIGSFSIQPTEFAKITIVLSAAKVLCDWREGSIDLRSAAVFAIVLVILPLAFMFKTQSDMGSALIMFVGIIAVLWIGEVPTPCVVGVIAIVIAVGCFFLAGYRMDRIIVWLNPWSDEYGTGYQMVHSFYAFANGGIFGVGLGSSREKYLYIPEAETDYIFAIIGEELGLVGAVLVILLFLAVLIAGLRIADAACDEFGREFCAGLVVMLVFQAFLNIACATGAFPTTGKPLPFISSGGSSVIASLMIVGLILSVSRVSGEDSYAHNTAEGRRANLNYIRVDDEVAPVSRRSGSNARRSVSFYEEVPSNQAYGRSRSRGSSRPDATISLASGTSRRNRDFGRGSSMGERGRR